MFKFQKIKVMKKIVLLVVMAITTSIYAKNPVKYETLYKLNNEVTFNSLSNYLNVTDSQKEELKYVFSRTEKKLRKALENEDYASANQVLSYNLGNVKYILTDIQYMQYANVVNVSIFNKYETSLMADNK